MPFFIFALLNPINDITTDFINPPKFIATQKLETHANTSLNYPDEFIEVQKKLHPEVKALSTQLVPQQAYQQALAKALAMPNWTITNQDGASLRIEAVAETPLLKFKDDLIIEVRATPGGGSEVHMRSRSRVGKGDFGANAKRIVNFFKVWPNAS